MATWLRPRLRDGWSECLRTGSERDICCDEAWLDLLDTVATGDLETLLHDLAEVLDRATLRTYHGTRTHDAGPFFEAGLQVHDRVEMTRRLTTLVEENDELAALRGARLSEAIAQIDNIGVITHVAAMIDRIAVQVRVERRGSGRSVVLAADWAATFSWRKPVVSTSTCVRSVAMPGCSARPVHPATHSRAAVGLTCA